MTTELPRLYRRNINGSIQVWVIEIDGEYYRTHEGILEKKDGNAGAITHSKWTKQSQRIWAEQTLQRPSSRRCVRQWQNTPRRFVSGLYVI